MGWLSSGCYVWGSSMTNYLILGLLVVIYTLIVCTFKMRRMIKSLQLKLSIAQAQKRMAENGVELKPDQPWPRKTSDC